MSQPPQLLVSIQSIILILSRYESISGEFLRNEIENYPANATLTSLGLDGFVDYGRAKVMMIENLFGQGRVVWVNEWRRAWFDGNEKMKRDLNGLKSDEWMDRRKVSVKKRKNLIIKNKIPSPPPTTTKRQPNKNVEPPKRMKRHFKFGMPRPAVKDLPHRVLEISPYDVFVSRYGIYIFIPAMMTFTLAYILCLKWKCLDADLVGIYGASAIFHSAGKRMLHSLSPEVKRDHAMGRTLVGGDGRKDEAEEVKMLFKGVTGVN